MIKTDYVILNATASGEVTADDNALMSAYSEAFDGLEMQVAYYLGEGWSLKGGVSVTTTVITHGQDLHDTWTEVRVMACQAMTKIAEVETVAEKMMTREKTQTSKHDYSGIPAIHVAAIPAALGIAF